MKFKFTLIIGFLIRKKIRMELDKMKSNLEYMFPGGTINIVENKDWFESEFLVTGRNFPETTECYNVLKNIEKDLKNLETE